MENGYYYIIIIIDWVISQFKTNAKAGEVYAFFKHILTITISYFLLDKHKPLQQYK